MKDNKLRRMLRRDWSPMHLIYKYKFTSYHFLCTFLYLSLTVKNLQTFKRAFKTAI